MASGRGQIELSDELEWRIETRSREEEGSQKMMRSLRSKVVETWKEGKLKRKMEEEEKITQESFLSWKEANMFLYLE